MDLHQMQIFRAVLLHGSVTKAARDLFLSPAAVSLQLRNLRTELGVDLFVKAGKTLAPTPIAHRLGKSVTQVLDLAQDIRDTFDSTRGDRHPFELAAGFTTMVYRLYPLIDDLQAGLPQNEIRLSIDDTEAIVDGVRLRRFDLGVISLPVSTRDVRLTPLFKERFVLVVSKPHLPRRKTTASLEYVQNLPFILYRKGTLTRRLVDRLFDTLGIHPRVVMEENSVEAIKKLIERGFGVSLLPESAIPPDSTCLKQVHIPDLKLVRQVALAVPDTEYPRRPTQFVAAFLKERLGEQLRGTLRDSASPR